MATSQRSASRRRPKRPPKKPLTVEYAIRSFTGFLEGTGKSKNTISSYRSDLNTFREFLKLEKPGKGGLELADAGIGDLQRYHEHLKKEGFRANTRRRKLLTVRRLYRYLQGRKRIDSDAAVRFPTPFKVERVPHTLDLDLLRKHVNALPGTTLLEARNRLILRVLTETGCLVSELCRMGFADWSSRNGKARVHIHGRGERDLEVPSALLDEVREFEESRRSARLGVPKAGGMFPGFNKFGPLSTSITPRGVELLLKAYSPRLVPGDGALELTPRLIRHSVVLHWFGEGVPRPEIQRRLGLRTDYAFRTFEPLLESGLNATRI